MQTPSFVIRNLLYIIKCCKVFVNSMFVFRQLQRAENPPRGLWIFVKDAHLQNFLSFLKKTLDFPGGGRYNKTRSPARTPREYAPVAQLDRVSDYESEGRGFESLPAHQEKQRLNVKFIAAFLFVFEAFLVLGAYLALTEFLDTLLSMSTTRKKDYLQPKLHHRRNDCLWWSFPLPLIYLIGSIISSVLS